MTQQEIQKYASELFNDCSGVLSNKGDAYSGENAFTYFERLGNIRSKSKYEVALDLMIKHVYAIMRAIDDNPDDPVEKSEGMRSRVLDVINYAVIIAAMCDDAPQGSTDSGGNRNIYEREDKIFNWFDIVAMKHTSKTERREIINKVQNGPIHAIASISGYAMTLAQYYEKLKGLK